MLAELPEDLKTVRVNFCLTAGLREAIKELAWQNRMTMSEWIRHTCEQAVLDDANEPAPYPPVDNAGPDR